MRVTCKHCGGAHPAFDCKKSTGAVSAKSAVPKKAVGSSLPVDTNPGEGSCFDVPTPSFGSAPDRRARDKDDQLIPNTSFQCRKAESRARSNVTESPLPRKQVSSAGSDVSGGAAQRLEPSAHNGLVAGSNPAATTKCNGLHYNNAPCIVRKPAAGSSNGRTVDFDSTNAGSTPAPASNRPVGRPRTITDMRSYKAAKQREYRERKKNEA